MDLFIFQLKMDFNKWTVLRLKDACTKRGIDIQGIKLKANIVESLVTYLKGKNDVKIF